MIIHTFTDKPPAQREASFVDRVIRGEDDEDSWTGGGNCAWVYNAVAAEFCRTGSRTVVQRHAVVAPTCVSLQRDVLKTHRYHLRQSNYNGSVQRVMVRFLRQLGFL